MYVQYICELNVVNGSPYGLVLMSRKERDTVSPPETWLPNLLIINIKKQSLQVNATSNASYNALTV